MIDAAARILVVARAGNRCEYCQFPQEAYEAIFHVDHVLAQQHLSDDSEGNLALCCPRCNRKKGPNLAGLDPLTQRVEPLFHPRRQRWNDHFRWMGIRIVAITPTGRATLSVLDLNGDDRLVLRAALAAEGRSPELH